MSSVLQIAQVIKIRKDGISLNWTRHVLKLWLSL